jgi:predicted DNA-binding transcriptional regulator YafY
MKRGSLRRIYELDRMIRLGKLESPKQAAGKLEVTPRTIERDLETLRWDLGADLVYDKEKGIYGYAGKPFVLPAQWLTEREIAILLIAERALRIYTSTAFDSEIHPTFNKLLDPIRHDKKTIDYIRDLCNSVHFHRPVEPLRDMRQEFSIVLDAIMQRRRLSMTYASARKREKPESRELDPYAIINNGGEWYVVGKCLLSKTEKTFVLSQMNELKIIDHYFMIPKEFSSTRYFEHSFGRMHGEKPEKVELEISPPASSWIGRNKWHSSQKIVNRKDGSILLSMTCPVTDSLVRWVLQMGECVTIARPLFLKELVAAKAKAVLQNNGNQKTGVD